MRTNEPQRLTAQVVECVDPLRVEPQFPQEWFHRHFDVLWRFVFRMGIAHAQVDDIVQEAFIAASRRRTDIRTGAERSFLMSTAVNLCANYRRRAHVRRELVSPSEVESAVSETLNAEQLLVQRERRRQLDVILNELSDPHRAVFVLYELEGFTIPEIAECLKLHIGTVTSRLGRARSKFSAIAKQFHSASVVRRDL